MQTTALATFLALAAFAAAQPAPDDLVRFQAPQLPAGWKMNRIPAGSTPGPTKVRSASN